MLKISELQIRNATTDDIPLLKQIFYRAIHEVCSEDYSIEERNVWSSSIKNENRWL